MAMSISLFLNFVVICVFFFVLVFVLLKSAR